MARNARPAKCELERKKCRTTQGGALSDSADGEPGQFLSRLASTR